MAKELPYFKFEPAEYLTKDVSFCSLSAQGLFINLCAYYWQRGCKLTKPQLLKRMNHEEELNELINEGVIDLKSDDIFIKFLDNQLKEVANTSKVNSVNGSKGGRPKKPKLNPNESETKAKLNPTINPIESQTKGIREDKIREDEIRKEERVKAIDFLNSNSQYETFVMQNKSLVKEWKRMIESYNDQIDLEIAQNKIKLEVNELMPRLRKYCRSWISNQKTVKSSTNKILL